MDFTHIFSVLNVMYLTVMFYSNVDLKRQKLYEEIVTENMPTYNINYK